MTRKEHLNKNELLRTHPWFEPGKWTVSPLNWHPEIRAAAPDMPESVTFSDQAFREAEDNIAVSLTVEDKIEIARRLCEIGVDAIDCGRLGSAGHEETMEKIAAGGVVSENVSLYLNQGVDDVLKQADELRSAVDRTVILGGDALNLVCLRPIEETRQIDAFVDFVIHTGANHPGFTLTPAWAYATASMAYTDNLPSLCASFEWQVALSKILVDAGVRGFGIADSQGCATPPAMRYIVSRFRSAVGPKPSIAVHCHNDFGLATANALAGVEGGADRVEAVVCGLGYRAGNTSMEEVVLGLEALYGIKTGIKMEQLYDLCNYIQEVSGAKVQSWKPLVGGWVWYESSLHSTLEYLEAKWAGKDFFEAAITETYNPKIIGRTHDLKFGRAAMTPLVVEAVLKHFGKKTDKVIIDSIVCAAINEIMERSVRGENKWLEEDEFIKLCNKTG